MRFEERDVRVVRSSILPFCFEKKPLSQRQHVCAYGVDAQCDLYSAFLAKYFFDDVLNTRQALGTWPGANLLLEQVVLRLQQEAAIGRTHPASFGLARAMKEQ